MREIASTRQLWFAFARWAVVTVPLMLLLGFASASLAPAGAENRWYAALVKPAGTPPDWVFPLAWTILYVLLGLALAVLVNARGARWRGLAIAVFALDFAVNLMWSPLFFGMHRVTWALVAVVAMVALTIVLVALAARVRRGAALMLLPYLAWVSYATYLTWGIRDLNPAAETLVPSATTTQIIRR